MILRCICGAEPPCARLLAPFRRTQLRALHDNTTPRALVVVSLHSTHATPPGILRYASIHTCSHGLALSARTWSHTHTKLHAQLEARHSTTWSSTAQHGAARHSTTPQGTAQRKAQRHSTPWPSTPHHHTVQHGHSTARHIAAHSHTDRRAQQPPQSRPNENSTPVCTVTRHMRLLRNRKRRHPTSQAYPVCAP